MSLYISDSVFTGPMRIRLESDMSDITFAAPIRIRFESGMTDSAYANLIRIHFVSDMSYSAFASAKKIPWSILFWKSFLFRYRIGTHSEIGRILVLRSKEELIGTNREWILFSY